MLEFPHHPFESAAPTSDDHNFPIRALICTFLDSTERLLSLEFYKIKYSAKLWAKQWSRTVEERSVLVSKKFLFSEPGCILNARDCVWPEQEIAC